MFSQEIDGHDHKKISDAIGNNLNSNGPNVIISNTIKGKGVNFLKIKMNGITQYLVEKILEGNKEQDKNNDF